MHEVGGLSASFTREAPKPNAGRIFAISLKYLQLAIRSHHLIKPVNQLERLPANHNAELPDQPRFVAQAEMYRVRHTVAAPVLPPAHSRLVRYC